MGKYYIQSMDPAELSSRFSTEDVIQPIHGQGEEWKAPRLEEIKDLLDRLPDRESDLVRLYFFKDKNQTDIAEIFGITQAAVSYRINRALARIRFLVDMPNLDKDDIYDILLEVLPSQLDAKIFSEMYQSTCQSEVADRLEITQGRVRHRFIKNLRFLGDFVVDQLYDWLDTFEDGSLDVMGIREDLDDVVDIREDLEDEEYEQELNGVLSKVEALEDEFLCDQTMEYAAIYQVFVRIRYNFNILREVKLPKWSNRATNVIA